MSFCEAIKTNFPADFSFHYWRAKGWEDLLKQNILLTHKNNCMIEIYFSVILTSWGALPRRSSSIRFSIFFSPCFSVEGHQKQVRPLTRFYSVYNFKIDGCHEKSASIWRWPSSRRQKNSFTEGHLLFPKIKITSIGVAETILPWKERKRAVPSDGLLICPPNKSMSSFKIK